jgi:hypothetical protein
MRGAHPMEFFASQNLQGSVRVTLKPAAQSQSFLRQIAQNFFPIS